MSSFDLLIFGRRKLEAGLHSSSSLTKRGNLTKVRLQIVGQVFNSRRIVYRNRIESNRCNLVLSTIENSFHQQQAKHQSEKQKILEEFRKQNAFHLRTSKVTHPDLTEPKDFYRFGVRVRSAGVYSSAVPPPPGSSKSSSTISVNARPHTAPTRSEESKENSSTTIDRIRLDVRMKTFALEEEKIEEKLALDYLNTQLEQKKGVQQNLSKENLDGKLEEQYEKSVRKRKEIEAFLTSKLIEEHEKSDPIFAKRYQQLKLAIRMGQCPMYDPNDRNAPIHLNRYTLEQTQQEILHQRRMKFEQYQQEQKRLREEYFARRIFSLFQHIEQLKES